ncbi:MAG: fused response regulator/phosphatase [Proteobacteria bacterium]|nr:MAG: fused response regulator/phosphatase [Pseudomonadota bacterium]
MRILVVDDTLSVRLVLASLLRKWGHEIVEAADGEAAWRILENDPVRLVISDWMMPELDGPGLCRRIRGADFDEYIYIILLTSRDDESDLVEGMSAGADDFVTKPFSRNELEVRIKAGIRVLELQARLARNNRELSEALGIVRRDLEAAARTQFNLLPESAARFGSARFDWLYCPSTYIGGDFIGYFALDDHRVAFYIIDVSGHGVPSALISATLSKYITPDFCRHAARDIAAGDDDAPARVVSLLNREFQNHGDDDFYFTMLYGVHDHRNGETRLCQAAHPCPLLLRRDGQVRELGDGGMPVAMLDFASYESFGVTLQPGDRLILYSDGVTECASQSGELYGEERFRAFLSRNFQSASSDILDTLRTELEHWSGGEGFGDDVSVLALEYDRVSGVA